MVNPSSNADIKPLKRLKIANIHEFVNILTPNYRVYAPVDIEGKISFRQFKNPDEISWDYSNSLKPAKEVIFPQTEEMFKYSYGKTESDFSIETPIIEDKPAMIMGIRPCDAAALTKTDHNFKGLFDDPYYLSKRENTVLVGFACDSPDFNCFCTSMEGGPYSRVGLDAMLIQIRDFFALEILTEKGEKLIKHAGETLKSTEDAVTKEILKQEESANAKIQRHVDIIGVNFNSLDVFENSLWAEVAERCISCGICVFVCPTCRCFDIQDQATSKKGRRIRIWDTCQFPEYTVHGSGYNPRPARTNRFRNRILCRLKYTVDKFGVGYCTGCGRCITYCPTNIDILENYEQFKGRIEGGSSEACAEPTSADKKSAEVKH